VAGALAVLDALPQSPWLLGQRLMQPDITVGAMLGYLRLRVPDALPEGRYPGLERLSAACEGRLEFADTRPAADETMPPGLGGSRTAPA